MVTRKTLLTMSIIVSLAFHGALVILSPEIPLLAHSKSLDKALESFQVRLVDVDKMPPVEEEFGQLGRMMTTRPGAVTDMLNRENEAIEPSESLLNKPVDVPLLPERLTSEDLSREHDLSRDEAVLKRIDGRILEISESTARKDINIARRLVAPSSNRIVKEDEFPVLRVAPGEETDDVLVIDPRNTGFAGDGAGLFGGRPGAMPGGHPEYIPPVTPSPLTSVEAETVADAPALDLVEPPLEKTVARRQIEEDIAKENAFELMDNVVDMKVDAYIPEGEKEGYFRLQIVPKAGEVIEPLPKDVTFVVDASSSIVQRKLDITIQGLRDTIASLRPEDQFNVVIFRDTAASFRDTPVPATPENRAAATEFLTGQQSRGETDVYRALNQVVQQKPRPGIPTIILVASDGKPTAGLKDGRTIINALTADNENRLSIYAYGGGKTVNRYLLDLLAYRNKGESYVSSQIENMSRDLPKFFSTVKEPLLVDCNADFGLISEDSIYPKQLPDFFKGQAVTVYGRFDPAKSKEFAVRLTGLAQNSKKEVIFKSDLSKAATGDNEIARGWALRKIYSIIDEMCTEGEKPELLAELRELSRKYNITTSYDY